MSIIRLLQDLIQSVTRNERSIPKVMRISIACTYKLRGISYKAMTSDIMIRIRVYG